MNRTWFNVPDSLKDKIVSWGVRDSTGFHEYSRIPRAPVTRYDAGSGLYSSPADYLAFLACLLNQGKYNGGQLLKAETIDSMFKNHLADNVEITYELRDDQVPSDRGPWLQQSRSDKFGLAWAIEENDVEKIRPKGSAYWGGAANTYYTIDNRNGVAIVYFSQVLPPFDKEAFHFYRLFEKQVFTHIDAE